MTDRALGSVMQQIRGLVQPAAPERSDAGLLEIFLEAQDQSAFGELMRRHGAMVLGVCQRVLRDGHQAEDAFQATFLILARKGGSVRKRSSLGSWLYGVAYRVARKMKPRRPVQLQAEVADMESAEREDRLWEELIPVIDQEMDGLPEALRSVLVLCCLEGKTYEEAARQLQLSASTVRGRLARGRELLRQRLAMRGVAAPVASLALLPANAQATPAARVVQRTLHSACSFAAGQEAGNVPASVAATVQDVLKEMSMRKLKVVALTL
ncbi:MAG: RNA polymerase sigma factor, partial [Gemmataceae bacterium]